MTGKKDSNVRDRKSQSASFKDIIEETTREDLERVWGGGGGQGQKSQFFICSGDVVVMKRNETAAATAHCPLVPQPQNEAKTQCLDTPHMKPDGDTYVSCLAVHSLFMFTAVSQN